MENCISLIPGLKECAIKIILFPLILPPKLPEPHPIRRCDCEKRQEADSVDDKIDKLLKAGIAFDDPDGVRAELNRHEVGQEQAQEVEHQEEEEAELDESETRELSVVELLTVLGSKGLSAGHVIIIGFDNVNMDWITRNAFFVAMTRARTSLHLITALRSGGAQRPARHLEHLPEQHIEFHKYRKGDRAKGNVCESARIPAISREFTCTLISQNSDLLTLIVTIEQTDWSK